MGVSEADEGIRRVYFERTTRITGIALVLAIPFFAFLSSIRMQTAGVDQVVLLALDFAFLAVFVMSIPLMRLAALPTEGSLKIRNKRWKYYDFPWNEVRDISFGYPEAPILDEVAVVTLNSGERIPIHALYAPNPWTRPGSTAAQEMTESLRNAKRIADENGGRIPSRCFSD